MAHRVFTSLLFNEPVLYLVISPRPFEDRAALVTGFAKKRGPAEKKGVRIGWVLASVDRIDCLQKTFAQTISLYRSAGRPVELKFVRDPDYSLVIHEPPVDLRFEPALDECVVAPFNSPPGPAEQMLGARLKVGDYVIGVNRINTSRMAAASVVKLLHDAPRPVEVRFGREGQKQQLVAAAIFDEGPMGLLLRPKGARVRFIRFHGVGPVERSGVVAAGHILIAVNGVAVHTVRQAREALQANPPLELRFRKMDVYLEGGWPPSTSALVSRGRVLYDFSGSQSDDLAVRAGAVVEITDHSADFWHCKDSAGKMGWVPSSYIERLSAMERTPRLPPPPVPVPAPVSLIAPLVGSPEAEQRRAMLAKTGMELVGVATSPRGSFDNAITHSAVPEAGDDQNEAWHLLASEEEDEEDEGEPSAEMAKFRVVAAVSSDFPVGDLVVGLSPAARGAVLVRSLRSRAEASLPLSALQVLVPVYDDDDEDDEVGAMLRDF